MRRRYKLTAIMVLLCLFLVILFRFLFVYDNKYSTPPPYGQDGVIEVTENELMGNKPIYLIDGWLLTDKIADKQQTYIGEYSNLQRGNPDKNPHGVAAYELTIRYTGSPMIAALDFQELFSKYKIYLNGELIGKGAGNARLMVQLNPGDNLIRVETVSYQGYYSGMYYPPALGTEQSVQGVERVKTLFYSVCLFCLAVLLGFTSQLWRRSERDDAAYWLALLCCCFGAYVSYYFVQLFALPIAPMWYYVEEAALYGLVFSMVSLTKTITGLRRHIFGKAATIGAVIIPAVLLTMHTITPYISRAVLVHGHLKDTYFVLIFLWLLAATLLCIRLRRSEYPYIVAGNLIFGAGLLMNLFQSNKFEPIYSLWQFEWCGLLLIWLFATMMVARNRRILKENKELTGHLESLVEQRTEELYCVLEERRAFFADMAHDLKAPLFATKTFIEAIREHSVGIDEELSYYLEQVDNKQTEMSKRVQSLGTLNKLDSIESAKERISVKALLEEVYAAHNAEAEVVAVHLNVIPPQTDCFVFMNQEKLLMVFENLVYNALRATPNNGSITICARSTGSCVEITVDDTGCGISGAELPLIFKRFYVGERNKAVGSGLGLYIVKTVIEEVHGSVSVTSQLGKGTRFMLELPLFAERRRQN